MANPEYPCPHGCTDHTVKSEDPTACGHYHSPEEWGHREQVHNSDYWAAIGRARAEQDNQARFNQRGDYSCYTRHEPAPGVHQDVPHLVAECQWPA